MKEKVNAELGINEQSPISKDPKKHGMDTVGKDQKPQATPKEKVGKNGKSFTIC